MRFRLVVKCRNHIDFTIKCFFYPLCCSAGNAFQEFFDEIKKKIQPAKKTQKNLKNLKLFTFTNSKISIDYKSFKTKFKKLKILPFV